MQILHLAFSSKLTRYSATLVLIFLHHSCSSNSSFQGQHVKKPINPTLPVSGTKIEPPVGMEKPRKDRLGVDKLLAELPEEARENGELSIPADPSLTPDRPQGSVEDRRRDFRAKATDEEITGGSRFFDERHSKDLGALDQELKVVPEENQGQAPSYLRGIQKIKELFKTNSYEEALLETNELLKFYPNSAQLLTMKGTLHQRMSQLDLALLAYTRAFDFEPSNQLKSQIDYLKRRIIERESLRKPREGIVTPEGVEETKYFPGGQ